MKTKFVTYSWDDISKRVYWDRDVSLEKWKEKVSIGQRSYLPGAVEGMKVTEFIHFYGLKKFVEDWPRLRTHLPEKIVKKTGMYDLAWSHFVSGSWNLRPFTDFYEMSERRRQFLIAVAKEPGRSIYEISKSLGLQYKRAYEHAKSLINNGRISGKKVLENGRHKTKLYPAYEKK